MRSGLILHGFKIRGEGGSVFLMAFSLASSLCFFS